MAIGKCRHCNYAPVGQDAFECPNCFGTYPNMSRGTKFGWLMLKGLAILVGFFFVAVIGMVIFFLVTKK
jgi:hypothetical protein